MGKTEIQEDLFATADRRGAEILTEVDDDELHDLHDSNGPQPWVSYRHQGRAHQLHGDFIAGCDGLRGVAPRGPSPAVLRCHEKVYPFGWLDVLSATPPLPEIAYANRPRGCALASARSPTLSRW